MFGYGDGGGVRKEDTALRDRLNEALKAVRASGDYDAITKRYFDFDIYGD
jgi:polar amino acid transport system substrate-binding protein